MHHPSFENQWISVFKWGDNPNISRIKDEINSLKINSDTQRVGLRQCLGNGILLDIRQPSYESSMGAFRTEIHIVKFKSHHTGVIILSSHFPHSLEQEYLWELITQ